MGLSCLGVVIGDRDDANEAGRSERNPGEPANDVHGLDAGSMGLRPALLMGLRPGPLSAGTFLAEILVGLDARDGEGPLIITQSVRRSLSPFSR